MTRGRLLCGMGQSIDDLPLETLLELFQALTDPENVGTPNGGWAVAPWEAESAARGEGGPLERVLVPRPGSLPIADRSEPVVMDEATDSDGGVWLWFEH